MKGGRGAGRNHQHPGQDGGDPIAAADDAAGPSVANGAGESASAYYKGLDSGLAKSAPSAQGLCQRTYRELTDGDLNFSVANACGVEATLPWRVRSW